MASYGLHAFVHAHESQATDAKALRIKAYTIVANRRLNVIGILRYRHLHQLCLGMARAVCERLLHHAIDTGPLGIVQAFQVSADLDIRSYSGVS